VYNTFESSGWHQYLAQMGYVVANINNRGSGGYGSKFEKSVHLRLGELETADFAEAALHLAENSWIDRERIAITGHSYGGFSSGMSLLTHPDVFKAGIVASATANHLNYDNIYTERYMGLKEVNAAGYKQSALITHAGNLQGEMMLVHGLMDDNVHPQNAFQLVKALIDHEKSIELKIFPPGTHGVAYDMKSRIFLYKEYLNFFEKHLK
jgi:dipeptidyl-peptidase-4